MSATCPVLNVTDRELFLFTLCIFWTIKSLLITLITRVMHKVFCRPDSQLWKLSNKQVSHISHFCRKKNYWQKKAMPVLKDSTEFREHMHLRFLNVQCKIWVLLNTHILIIATLAGEHVIFSVLNMYTILYFPWWFHLHNL